MSTLGKVSSLGDFISPLQGYSYRSIPLEKSPRSIDSSYYEFTDDAIRAGNVEVLT